MDLPLSEYEAGSCGYHFGFDPINKLYKLLKTCAIYEEDEHDDFDGENLYVATLIRNLNCEILTIGVDKSRRRIDFPPWEIIDRSVCINGALYWLVSSVSIFDDFPSFPRKVSS
ncbi:hypothetical protein ACH5RR_022677 [Cinchona calisaya]|uniref:F-box associated beta-propeller type 3 domain-containing protein n=1 Tax=Cinchona calisaya TaxID=153742 RepID=A0ABD2ZBV5_9GENT